MYSKILIGLYLDFNECHPEIKKGEMFLSNTTLEDYHCIRWMSKRKGITAYTINGKVIKGMFPVFVQKQEYDEGMKRI